MNTGPVPSRKWTKWPCLGVSVVFGEQLNVMANHSCLLQPNPRQGGIHPTASPWSAARDCTARRWCKSSAMCSYPCLLNGLKTVENRKIIFYFNDQKGVTHYSQPTHKMLWFSIFLHWSFSPFGSWPSSSHGFSKKGGKKPKQKTQTPIISISDKQNSREWGGKDLTCKSCEQSCLCSQQLDVFMAVGEAWVQESISWMFGMLDIALQTAAALKWHFLNKFLQLFLHC